MNLRRLAALAGSAMLVTVLSGCGGGRNGARTAADNRPSMQTAGAAGLAAKPVIESFLAEPSTVARGSGSTLKWAVTGATEISIDPGLGSQPASSSRMVYPPADATYTLVARGPGGVTEARVPVRVLIPGPGDGASGLAVSVENGGGSNGPASVSTASLLDVFFDLNSFEIREDGAARLKESAAAIRQNLASGAGILMIEGHCDERGSDAFNVALGDRRAQAAVEYLKNLGVPADRLKTTSYGKERPQCADSTEECWQKNRRVHLAVR